LPYTRDIESALPVLKNGGLILLPTDTVWAIGCDATNKKAVEKLYLLKNKRTPENLVVLLANEQDIPKYTSQKNVRVFDYIKGVHKPTTVVYEQPRGLPESITDDDGTIAIRVIKDFFLAALIREMGKPLLSATANISGDRMPSLYSEINNNVISGVDYVVKYRQEETIHHEPSSIIRWNKDGSITILRA
jgi:L-threonylcarbamoyladenylate synthase